MKPVIEISTARKREHAIKIDGKLYELRHPGELSYLDGKSFRVKAARLTGRAPLKPASVASRLAPGPCKSWRVCRCSKRAAHCQVGSHRHWPCNHMPLLSPA